MVYRTRILLWAWVCVAALTLCVDVSAQRRTKKKPAPSHPPSELSKLHEEFIQKTNEYKASLGKLLPYYESYVKKAEENLEKSKKLLAEGLIAKKQVEENERELAVAKEKIAETNRLMKSADEQVAAVLVEAAANDEIAKNLRLERRCSRLPISNARSSVAAGFSGRLTDSLFLSCARLDCREP
jgi:multidrug resistance efflux pump